MTDDLKNVLTDEQIELYKQMEDVEMFDKLNSIMKLNYVLSLDKCNNCKGFELCDQVAIGSYPTIKHNTQYDTYYLDYKECSKQYGTIKGRYRDKILNAPRFIKTSHRKDVMKKLMELKGGYIYGETGSGKTTMTQILANHLYKKGHNIMFEANFNINKELMNFNDKDMDFLREIEKYQQAEILFIDDLFREDVTKYKIMEIFNPIFQYRFDNDLPTYITSNYSYTDLRMMIEDKTDETSSKTITSRIKKLGIYKLEDRNYREEST